MSVTKQVLVGIAAAVGAALLLRAFDRARQATMPARAGTGAQVGGYTDERGQFRMVTIL